MAFDRARLLAAFDRIGSAALANGGKLELAVYRGSALLLASNFRFATEDVDVADISEKVPTWLSSEIEAPARENDWAEDCLKYLTFSSPGAFKRRNIMTDGAPLRRARMPSR